MNGTALAAILAALPPLIIALVALVKAIRGDARTVTPPPPPPSSPAATPPPSRLTD